MFCRYLSNKVTYYNFFLISNAEPESEEEIKKRRVKEIEDKVAKYVEKARVQSSSETISGIGRYFG